MEKNFGKMRLNNFVVNGSKFEEPITPYIAERTAIELEELIEINKEGFPMVWKKHEEANNFVALPIAEDYIVGKLLKRDESQYAGAEIYTLEIEEAVSNKIQLTINEESFPNKEARIFGSTVLTRLMRTIKLGTRLKIVYKGKTIAAKKGKAKDWVVFKDE